MPASSDKLVSSELSPEPHAPYHFLYLRKGIVIFTGLSIIIVGLLLFHVYYIDTPSQLGVHVSDSVDDVVARYGTPPCEPEGCYENGYKAECWCGGDVYVNYASSDTGWIDL
jgi:hypothetical protein